MRVRFLSFSIVRYQIELMTVQCNSLSKQGRSHSQQLIRSLWVVAGLADEAPAFRPLWAGSLLN